MRCDTCSKKTNENFLKPFTHKEKNNEYIIFICGNCFRKFFPSSLKKTTHPHLTRHTLLNSIHFLTKKIKKFLKSLISSSSFLSSCPLSLFLH